MSEDKKDQVGFVISVKTLSSLVAAFIGILSALWALDSHYASAADVERIENNFTSQIDDIRKEKIEDEIFSLEVKKESQGGKLNAVDQAMYERYKRRLQDFAERRKEREEVEKARSNKPLFSF